MCEPNDVNQICCECVPPSSPYLGLLSATLVLLFAQRSTPVMEDYDVDMDEEKEGEVFTRKATQSHCREDCGENGIQQQRGGGEGGGGGMVNSRSWAEELQDIFVQPAEEYFGGRQTRRSSISVSDGTVFL